MKKVLFLSLMLVMGGALASNGIAFNTCALGQRCQIPLYSIGKLQGFVGNVNIVLPTPSLQAPKLGNFQCTFVSSDPALANQLVITVGAITTGTGNPGNLPFMPQPVTLENNISQSFSVNWTNPNAPHKGIRGVTISSENTLPYSQVNPNDELFLTCVKN